MYTIQTLNNIVQCGLDVFENQYEMITEGEADGILLRSFPMHTMELPASVKAIARAGAGVNNIPVEACTEKGIVVFNTPGANANAVKEMVLASLLLASRNLWDGINWAKSLHGYGDIVPELVEAGKKEYVGNEIRGKRLGIIGLGAIGALVANDALALEMEVVGYDPYVSVETAWRLSRQVQRAMNLEQIFATCDYITIHVPLVEQTRGLLNAHAFRSMKKGVRIFNFSRGELVQEEDLRDALESGIVANYVTDFPNNTVLGMKNVIPIPHLGASTYESEENCAIMAARQLKTYLETGNIRNSVNFPNVELPYFGQKRITVAHKNVPNMVGQMTAFLAEHHINIADMINRSKGSYAYTIIDIDNGVDARIKEDIATKIKNLPGVAAVRIIQ
ncbi:phosphoglycerate dehydrogenase [Ectobacillus sp. JY-23]|uniref:phosphoglycerate dehydrogenase n=1 Tax=Ectobacillus sp. JY-23 TaxID=2933872 RepID=UPI001FF66BFC|nr:phosphoglycerate dehydrogenase [Ectobacillus sp. JY-23]UOY93051.1 phosphoglycerate dehydrogenase [Ectobacillus sp. JY-23]